MSDNSNNTLEILVNLIYLARHADDPQKMIEYLGQAENQVWQLAKSFQSSPATVQNERSPD